jgi:D-aspartate ligase
VHKTFENGAVIIGGDFQGLGIARNLAPLRIPVIIVDPDFCIGRFSKFVQKYYRCPPLTDMEAFVSFLKELASEEGLDKWVLYPTSDMAVHVLSKYKDTLDDDYLLPTPEWQVTQFAYDKRLSHQLAEQLKVPVPKTWFPEKVGQLSHLRLDFPVILKPTIKDNPHYKEKSNQGKQ